MTTITRLVLLATLTTTTALTIVCTSAAGGNPLDSTCPWRTVANVNDPSVQGYGAWASMQVHLAFVRVESATAQAVDDCGNNIKRNYALIIDATNRAGGEVNKYKALVYVVETVPIKLLSIGSVARHPPAKIYN